MKWRVGGEGYCEYGDSSKNGERGRGEYNRTHIGQRQDNIHNDMMR